MRKNKVFDFWFRKQYIIAGALVLFASFGLTALYSHNQEQERIRLEQELAEKEEQEQQQRQEQLAKKAEEEAAERASSVVPPKNTAIDNSAKNTEVTLEDIASVDGGEFVEGEAEAPEVLVEPPVESVASVSEPVLHFAVESGLLWPMDGNVIMNYSMESTIYHATLDQYKCNPAIIIAGEVNNKVFAAAKGKITDISQNEVTGTTVVVDMGDGYEAIYGQLKELNFEVGDYLEAGHVIGYISEPTKYYSVEGSNLYFELRKDGTPIDPIVYFE